MERRRGIVPTSGRDRHGAGPGSAVGARRPPGLLRPPSIFAWLATASLLLPGWLPIALQVHLARPEADGHAHRAHATQVATAPAMPSGHGRECPLLHSAICLCAAFVKVLPASGASASGDAFAARRRRRRLPASRPLRSRRALPFEARAPPDSG
jgi:hypothetical protein